MLPSNFRIVVTCLLAFILAACATTTSERTDEVDRRILAELEAALDEGPPKAAETRDLLLPPAAPAIAPPPEERFHLAVEDAPIGQFLMSLVADTDLNMTVHPDVTGRISLELRHVTIDEVMELVREIHDIEYRRTPSGYVVLPPRLENRIYEISYLDINRRGTSRTRVSSGQSTENPAALQDQQQMGLVGGGGLGRNSEDRASGTRIETESESDFWVGLQAAIEAILDNPEGRNVMVNPMSGVISVRAMPHEQRNVAELLDAIQGSVQRQVILEAKIIEVELRDGFRSGINWTAMTEISGRSFGFGQVAGQGLFEDGTSAIRGRNLNVRPGEAFDGFDSSAFGGAGVLTADSSNFNAFIELLETQGTTRVLSSPRVSTINNQKAVIKVGTDEFFVTGVVSRTASAGVGATAASSVELTPFFSGIALDVTPQISRNGDVILHIHPTVSEVTDQTKSFTVAGQAETLPLAFSSVRQSDSVIRARNGQVVVIGGLMRESSDQRRAGTPGVSRIPLLGQAFGSRQERTVKTELVILLRPIVVEDNTWNDQVSGPLERIRAMAPDLWPR